jgi:mono/diheme cytochrome c family protein
LASQIASGKEIYMKAAPGGGLCFTCHQPTGLGLPGQFPPLAGSDWVLGDKERLIKISMHGLMGEIEVNGVKYNNVMAPPGIPPGSLTDQQIADVLTYIRNDWGNSASSVSPAEVANIRSKVKDRAPMQMWTSAELKSN